MATWPSNSIIEKEPTVVRRQITAVETTESDAGTEDQRSNYTSPRYEYDLSYPCLRSDVAVSAPGEVYDGLSEIAAIGYLMALGPIARHSFTEPALYGGTTRVVRPKENTFELRQIEAENVCSCTLTLISVL